MTQHDPVQSPSHYRGASGLQSIEITHAYRLGPDLTQAVDYILRAGRKTPDPRQDLAKAAFYLRYAAGCRDLVFGHPYAPPKGYSLAEIAADFGLTARRISALSEILGPRPHAGGLRLAALCLDEEIAEWTAAHLHAANAGRSA